MADAAGISKDTVDNIMARDIKCPPIDRLEGFAKALDISKDQMVNLFEGEGCDYTDQGFTKRDTDS